jgi:hypothetical protein
MAISFKTTSSDAQLIGQIADRPCTVWPEGDRLNFEMDLTATHANGCPLKLAELLAADNFNFSHDIAGIYRHLDRTTGQLGGHFLPRFACKQ